MRERELRHVGPTDHYLGEQAGSVSVSYSDLMADSSAIFVDESGHDTASNSVLSVTGEAKVPTNGLAPGEYYLSARRGEQEEARTVPFYISGGADGDQL